MTLKGEGGVDLLAGRQAQAGDDYRVDRGHERGHGYRDDGGDYDGNLAKQEQNQIRRLLKLSQSYSGRLCEVEASAVRKCCNAPLCPPMSLAGSPVNLL